VASVLGLCEALGTLADRDLIPYRHRRCTAQDAFGAFLLFDLTSEETFTNVLKVRAHGRTMGTDCRTACWWPRGFTRLAAYVQWKRDIDSKVTLPNGKPLPVYLIANKVG